MAKDLKTLALEAIEGLMLEAERTPVLFDTIYQFAHVGLGKCQEKHADWRQELRTTHQQLREHKVI